MTTLTDDLLADTIARDRAVEEDNATAIEELDREFDLIFRHATNLFQYSNEFGTVVDRNRQMREGYLTRWHDASFEERNNLILSWISPFIPGQKRIGTSFG